MDRCRAALSNSPTRVKALIHLGVECGYVIHFIELGSTDHRVQRHDTALSSALNWAETSALEREGAVL
jgi:hypothetical protein